MAVRTLSWDEYLAEASEARRGVFVEASQRSSQWGFEEFTPQIASRVLLVPEVRLGEEELSALERAARSVGDDHFYFCSEAREPVYCIPFGNYMGYIEAVESGALIPFWNVLHSPRGVWGLDLTSDYGTAAGGSPDFIRALLDAWPDVWDGPGSDGSPKRSYEAREQRRAYTAYVRALQLNEEGHLARLENVYGRDEAERLFAEYSAERGGS